MSGPGVPTGVNGPTGPAKAPGDGSDPARGRRAARPAAPPVQSLWPPASPTPGTAAPDAAVAPGPMVRPYAMTGGRTRSKGAELALETMVATTPLGRAQGATLAWERRAIVELCATPLSVAEVSAHLDVPLGVARVLVGDLAAEGMLSVHGGAAAARGRDDLPLLERVLQGLRAL